DVLSPSESGFTLAGLDQLESCCEARGGAQPPRDREALERRLLRITRNRKCGRGELARGHRTIPRALPLQGGGQPPLRVRVPDAILSAFDEVDHLGECASCKGRQAAQLSAAGKHLECIEASIDIC